MGVIADGSIETTNGNYRFFFVVFVMLSVFAGAIIDTLDGVQQELKEEREGNVDPLTKLIMNRMSTTRGPSGNFYSDIWELEKLELYGEVRCDAQLCKTLKNAMDDDGDVNRDLKGEAEEMTEKLTEEKEALMEQLKPLMLHNRRMGHYSVL